MKILEVFGQSPWRLLSNTFSPAGRQVLIASGPLLSTISLGMTFGYSAVLLPQLKDSTITLNKNSESWIASMAVLPMALACFLSGFLMEKFGRKTTQILTTIPCLLGWIIISISTNLSSLLVGRFLTGLCGGLLGPCTGVYISETAEPKLRSFLLGSISLAVAIGLFVVHLLGTFLHWKTVAIISCFPPLLSVALLFFVPESPSWLVKNKKATAESAFYWCRGDDETTKKEFAKIEQNQDAKENLNLKNLCEKSFLKPLMVIVVFIVSNQWAGVNALTFYTVSIMQDTLNDTIDKYVAMLIVDLIRVFMSIFACFIMSSVKRRPLALISGFGTTASLFILSLYTFIIKSYPVSDQHWLAVIPMVSLIAYITFITIGFVPLPWAMMGEVFPLKTRNVGSSISSFMGYFAFFTVVKTNLDMFRSLGVDGTFLLFGVVAVSGTLFNLAFLPETKDKTLNEIEDQMCDNDKSERTRC